MKTTAAVLTEVGKPFEIVELELDGPQEGEVLVRYVAAGLCHSDLHLMKGDFPSRLPIVGGHEGAGVVEEVGPGVTKVKAGDHVLVSFIPSCSECRWCRTGHQNLCDLGEFLLDGQLPDGTFRFRLDGEDAGGMCSVGSFSQFGTLSQHSVIKVDESHPLEKAVLASCGVPTGWGTAVNAAGVSVGDTAVIYGSGGVGINAVQGAAAAGAKNVVVVDPVAFKRDTALKLGATHVFADAESALEAVWEMTNGQGAEKAMVIVGDVNPEVVTHAFNVVGKAGTVAITAMARGTISVSSCPPLSSRCSRRRSRAASSVSSTRSTTSPSCSTCTAAAGSSSMSWSPASTSSRRSTRAIRTCSPAS